MKKMTIESARTIIETPIGQYASDEKNQDTSFLIGKAFGFVEGYDFRQPEIDVLNKTIDFLRETSFKKDEFIRGLTEKK